MGRFLVVESDSELAARLSDYLGSQGHLTDYTAGYGAALVRTEACQYDLIIMDMSTVGESMEELLQSVRARNPEAVVLVMSNSERMAHAVRAIRKGATDFIQKPVDFDELGIKVEKGLNLMHLRHESTVLRGERNLIYRTANFVGRSPAIRRVLDLVEKVAPSSSSIVLQGETGTGKELIAGAIHYNSHRAQRAFVRVNCAALPDPLLESELFGHERGAFTGAEKLRIGRFEQADGGTILLDEIAEVSPAVQAKLLRVVQEHELERLGSNRTIHIDVRIISATNRSLPAEVEQGRFRSDLYYRLNVISITLPPLREREGDVELLANYFLLRYAGELDKKVSGFDDEALKKLQGHSWPGNIRELKNTIERAVILAETDTVTLADLQIPNAERAQESGRGTVLVPPEGLKWDDLERSLVVQALEMSGWSQKEAAQLLGLSTRVLNYKVKSFGITHPSWRQNR